MTFRERYRTELERTVAFEERELQTLTASLRQKLPQKERARLDQKRFARTCLAVLLLLALLTGGAFAALRLLAPHEVAEKLGDAALAAVLREVEENTEPQSVTDGDYTVTLLGLASGSNIRAPEGSAIDPTHSYAVVVLGRADGQPIRQEENGTFLFLPLISGYAPERIAPFTMTIARSAFYLDGVCYNLVDMMDLTAFSDHALWLCVLQTPFSPADALTMEPQSGDPVYRDNYSGVRALFRLPVLSGKADPQRAGELLRLAGLE